MAKRVHQQRRRTPTMGASADERGNPSRRGYLPIVGVGASAGGLEAFSALLGHLPLDTGMAFVLVQHLDPQHESALTQLLARATSLPVHEVTNNLRVEADHVYVIPPNSNLRIAQGVLQLEPRRQARVPQRSIDFFFESLAEDQHERAVGVILSGTATDGTLGLEAIKAEGGITFAQDESARYDSMSRSAIAAGCVDFILPPESIAKELTRIARHPYVAAAAVDPASPEDERAFATAHEDDQTPLPSGGRGTPRTAAARAKREAARGKLGSDGFRKILLLLRNHSGVDFSLYKSTTVQRRITRRMVLSKQDTLTGYANFLRGNSKELDALYSDVLISVTSFFRNPDAFEALKREVFPRLLKQRGDDPLRVWVLGCSTGQEAYSIAMTFAECAERAPRMRKLQVFATDLNEALLDKARHGLYAKSLANDVSPERLRRFFVEEQGGYRVCKPLREMVVFARQSLITDPPFSRLDLISCRNLLIYLEPSLQKKALPTFHYALKPGGFLFLGASESIGGFTELFEPVDRKNRIYARRAAPTPPLHPPPRRERSEPAPRSLFPQAERVLPQQSEAAGGFRAELSPEREADRVTVNQFAPPGVLVNAELQVLQFRGATGAYLEPPAGKASFDVLRMAREGLMLPLRTAIKKARKANRTAHKEKVRVRQNGGIRTVNIEVIPLKNLQERCFLILFEDAEEIARATASARTPAAGLKTTRADRKAEAGRVAALESELAETRDYLQAIQEQHESANEELQAANEEVQSANEELQSINEELETSKEELESANEELITLNEEVANRNAELSRLNSDLTNLQTSTRLAILVLGRDLTIRRFSAQAEKQFDLLVTDLGRPLGYLRRKLVFPATDGGEDPADLESLVADVVASMREREREVRDQQGRWYSLRVRPYLTADDKMDGAVLVLVDIDALKRSAQIIAEARDYAENTIATVREPLLVLDPELRVESANPAFYRAFRAVPDETIGRFLFDLGNRQWDIPALRSLLQELLPRNGSVENFEVEHDFPQLGRRTMLLNARRIDDSARATQRILLAIEDISDRRREESARALRADELQRANERLRESELRFSRFMEQLPGIAWIKDLDGRYVYANDAAEKAFGVRMTDLVGKTDEEVFPPETAAQFREHDRRALESETGIQAIEALPHPDGTVHHSIVSKFSIPGPEGEAAMLGGVAIDITERKRYEDALSEADQRKNEFLAMLAHELRNPLAPIRNSLEIMRRSLGADPSSSDPIRSAIEMMERQVGQMVRLVDDLLDLGRISRGKIDLRRERVELASVVHSALDTVRPLFERMSHELTVTMPPGPVYVNADPARLAQVVGNLLNNACKFTGRGGHVWLAVEGESASGNPDGEVVIRVRDTGVGIAPDQLSRIFDMFAQVDNSLERSTTGLGIGLTLVNTLVELHRGTVEARSGGVGQGSEFVVRLPIMVDPPQPLLRPAPTEPTAGAARRILVVDDNRDEVESLAMLLQLGGHETHMAHDGLEAVEAAKALQPDVILLDVGLPGLNGYEVARRIREQQKDKRTVLVALTGWGQDDDRRRSKQAGFDAHLVKPVDPTTLRKLLDELGAGPGA